MYAKSAVATRSFVNMTLGYNETIFIHPHIPSELSNRQAWTAGAEAE